MDECGSAAAGQAAAAGWTFRRTTSERQRVYSRHRDGRNILMPLFTSVSPVRAASLPEPLTAVMGLALDTTSAPEGRRNPAELSATEIARLVTSGDVSTIIVPVPIHIGSFTARLF